MRKILDITMRWDLGSQNTGTSKILGLVVGADKGQLERGVIELIEGASEVQAVAMPLEKEQKIIPPISVRQVFQRSIGLLSRGQ